MCSFPHWSIEARITVLITVFRGFLLVVPSCGGYHRAHAGVSRTVPHWPGIPYGCMLVGSPHAAACWWGRVPAVSGAVGVGRSACWWGRYYGVLRGFDSLTPVNKAMVATLHCTYLPRAVCSTYPPVLYSPSQFSMRICPTCFALKGWPGLSQGRAALTGPGVSWV